MAFYPRKQTLAIFAVCSIAVVGAAYYARGGSGLFFSQKRPAAPAVVPLASTGATAVARIDSNEDWKKQFLAAEEAGGSFTAPKKAASAPAAEEKLTPTDVLARNFLTQYVQLRQLGLNEDDQSVSTVMDQVIRDSSAALPAPKEYSLAEAKIVADSAAARAAYVSAVRSVMAAYDSQQYEGDIAAQALETENMSLLAKIDPVIASYKAMIAGLKTTPVPSSLGQYHLNLVNSLGLALYSAQAFRNMDKDAFTGFAAIRLNAIAVQNLAAAFSGIRNSI